MTDSFLLGGVGAGGVVGEPGFGGGFRRNFVRLRPTFRHFVHNAPPWARGSAHLWRAAFHSMESTRSQFLPADALAVDGTEMDSLKMTMEGRAFDPQRKRIPHSPTRGNDLIPNGAPGENPGHCPRCHTHLKSIGRSEEFLVLSWMRTDCEVVEWAQRESEQARCGDTRLTIRWGLLLTKFGHSS